MTYGPAMAGAQIAEFQPRFANRASAICNLFPFVFAALPLAFREHRTIAKRPVKTVA
jgi:hypothetical protein